MKRSPEEICSDLIDHYIKCYSLKELQYLQDNYKLTFPKEVAIREAVKKKIQRRKENGEYRAKHS